MTPFEAVYGYPPPSISAYLPGSSPVHSVDTTLRDQDALLRRLCQNLQLAQGKMHQQTSHKMKDLYEVYTI